jgi:lysophospholipase L1-like esterase
VELVLVVPWYREFEDHAPVLREFAAARAVALIDLPRRLQNLPRPRASYFLDSVHPTAEGHRLIAQAIQEELQALWH